MPALLQQGLCPHWSETHFSVCMKRFQQSRVLTSSVRFTVQLTTTTHSWLKPLVPTECCCACTVKHEYLRFWCCIDTDTCADVTAMAQAPNALLLCQLSSAGIGVVLGGGEGGRESGMGRVEDGPGGGLAQRRGWSLDVAIGLFVLLCS